MGLIPLMVLLFAPKALAIPLKVRDTPQVSGLIVTQQEGQLLLQGNLQGSSGEPLSSVALALDQPFAPCSEDAAPNSDENGAFCLSTNVQPGTWTHLRTAESEFYSALDLELQLIPQRPPLKLRLPPEHLQFDLDNASNRVFVELSAPEAHTGNYRVHLVVHSEAAGNPPLWTGTGQVNARQPAKFDVPSAPLGAPGMRRLLARLEELTDEAVGAEQPLELFGEVELAWAEELKPVTPESGFELSVQAISNGVPVTLGKLEVEINNQPMATVDVRVPLTRIPFAFSAPRQQMVTARVLYHPTDPHFRAGTALDGTLLLEPRSPLRQLPWLMLAIGAAYWVMRAWRRPVRKSANGQPAPPQPRKAGVVIHSTHQEHRGWRGRVVDAHTKTPIVGAIIRITRPALDERSELATAETDADGNFELETHRPTEEGARWIVEAEHHSTLVTPVPTMGSIEILLVSRRRTLLEAMIRWARSVGSRGNAPPTPQEVATAAHAHREGQAAEWALGIENAAYGPEAPTAKREQELLTAAPPLDRHGPDKR